MIKLNLNSILVILGGLGIFAPDVQAIALWLDGLGIHWVSYVAKALGFVAVFFAAAPKAIPKLRAFLALFGLATPAGTIVEHPDESEIKKPKDSGKISTVGILVMLIGGLFIMALMSLVAPTFEDKPDPSSSIERIQKGE